MTAAIDAGALRAALAGSPWAARVEVHEELASTVDRCRQLADLGAPEGTVVIAAAQSLGRGQLGRTWFSPPGGGLYLSALLRPSLPPRAAGALAQAVGLAACEALRSLGVSCRLKLPNDLVAVEDGRWRKLGGMLVDTAIQGDGVRHAIVSLGVNVSRLPPDAPPEIAGIATSCAALSPDPPSLEAIAGAFLGRLAVLASEHFSDDEGRAALAARHEVHVRPVLPGQPAAPGDEV